MKFSQSRGGGGGGGALIPFIDGDPPWRKNFTQKYHFRENVNLKINPQSKNIGKVLAIVQNLQSDSNGM